MGNWNYQRNEGKGFEPVPVGNYRIRIKSAEKAVSNSGNDMIVLQFEVSGHNSLIWHYIVFMNDNPDITNRNLTQFFDSFKDIPDGDLDTSHWVGKVGACRVKHEPYNGEMKAKIHYFISKEKQADLPAWVEPENGSNTLLGAVQSSAGAAAGVDELPPF